jgi:D-alanine-D-alanine ligase
MGGYSSERLISLKSGGVVCRALDKNKYNVYAVDIAREGWYYINELDERIPVDRNDFSVMIDGEKVRFDVVFNAIHGSPGENGLMQAYFELMGIPHTSCGHFESALTFNKRECLAVARQYGIPTAPSVFVTKGDDIDLDAVVEVTGLPCFVKPNRAGSSFGISKVYKKEDIPAALNEAYREDNEVLIEGFLDGREVTVGVMRINGKVTVLPITEIVSMNDFFDYRAKYEGLSKEITPAELPQEIEERVKDVAIRTYEKLNMRGVTRTEYIIVDGIPHILEVNTCPGLSAASIVPQQAAAMGMSLTEFFGMMIQDALSQ